MDSNTPYWPDPVPLPMEDARQTVASHNLNTVMETERVRSRRTLLEPVKSLDVVWALTRDQFDTFKTFFADELVNGSLSFVIEIFGEDQEMAFLDSRYTFARSDNLFMVSATLEYASTELPAVTLVIVIEEVAA